MKDTKNNFISLRVKLLVGFTLLFSVVFAGAYYWFYTFATAKAMERIQEDLIDTLEGTIDGIDSSEFVSLSNLQTPSVRTVPDQSWLYQKHQNWLRQIHIIEPRANPYTFIRGTKPNEILWIGDFLRIADPEASSFKESYIGNGLMYLGLTKLTLRLTPYTDRWGHWVSAYGPIYNSTGQVVGGVGVDFNSDYVLHIQQEIISQILPAFAIAYGTLFVLVFILSDALTKKLIEFTRSVERIKVGQYVEDLSFATQSRFYSDELDKLAQAFESMVENIRSREKFLQAIVEDQTESICRFLPDGTLTFANNAYCRLIDRQSSELVRQNFVLGSEVEYSVIQDYLNGLNLDSPVSTFEYQMLDCSNEVRWHQWVIRAIFDEKNQLSEFQAVGRDVTGRKQAEDSLIEINLELENRVQERANELKSANQELERQATQLKASLLEKELLLKEVHHRVKNNLQVISSIFSLQSQYVEDAQVLAILAESQERLRSMALIHEKLYSSDNLGKINFSEYIKSLIGQLFLSYDTNSKPVQLSLKLADVSLSLDIAVPCGLLLNELVSNALKHAFPYQQSGEVVVIFGIDNEKCFNLCVRDNGVGLPEQLDLQRSNSLGLRLIQALVRQLRGTLTIQNQNGVMFQIIFPQSEQPDCQQE
jgi:PAS domain S-box-containing protein